MRTVILFCTLLLAFSATAETTYDKPKIPLLSVITEIPTTALNTVKYSFTKESVPAWATIISTTLVMYHYDDDLYFGARADGRRWGIGNDDKTKTIVKGFGFDLLRVPTDTGSWMYFLGDGWMHMGIAAGFFATGYFKDANRPYNTGLQMVHGMVTSTIFSQGIKRATGRESPNKATSPRGRWRPFPSIEGYQSRTAEYDAFPSGHIMTATLVFTIMATNYPEYSPYILATEAVWLTALGFEMVNNGVHWASDYPLGIGIGYAVAKMATHMNEPFEVSKVDGKTPASRWSFFPTLGGEVPQMNAMLSY